MRSTSVVRDVQGDVRERFYERFADDFDQRMNRYEVAKRLRLIFDEALADIPLAGRMLLDAGCGTGAFSQVAAEQGALVTSLDVGEALLAQVARKCDSRRVVGDVLDLPFEQDRFDVVICTEVIEHTPVPERAIGELARVLRPGGRLVLTTPNRSWHWSVRLANALRARPYRGLENWVRPDAIMATMRLRNLEPVDQRGFNAFPWVHPVTYPVIDRLDSLGRTRLGRTKMINFMVVAAKPPVNP